VIVARKPQGEGRGFTYIVTTYWKWAITNSSYIFHLGFDEDKIVTASSKYLDSVPTTGYIPSYSS